LVRKKTAKVRQTAVRIMTPSRLRMSRPILPPCQFLG
jgi:hypothetical protein